VTSSAEFLRVLLESGATLQKQGRAAMQALEQLGEVEVGLLEKAVVYREERLRLYRYRPLARSRGMPPLLICYAMVNRPYILDLQPDRSVIRELLLRGLDVYLLDWGYPDGADRFNALEDYICGSLHRCVEAALNEHSCDALNLLGVCQGGVLSLCYTALESARICTLITMGTPVDFKTPENLLSKWAQKMDLGLLTQSGNVPGEFLNGLFLALMPFRLTQQKYVHLLKHAGDRARLEQFRRMEKWIFDTPDQPARALREFVQFFFHENRLLEGSLMLGNTPVSLAKIHCPVLNVYATLDHIVPPSATTVLGAKIGSADYEELALDAGHVGMFVSRKSFETVPDAIVRWLEARVSKGGK
jgi:polyhydroxyalkanoate synthase subunit PhaC